VLMLFLPLFL
jgi:hypothetical protein